MLGPSSIIIRVVINFMNRTTHFNYHVTFMAIKIYDVVINGMLASEFTSV